MERGIVAGDFHFCSEDKRAVALFLKFVKWFKPHFVCLSGDIIDAYAVSSFLQHPNAYIPLEQEFAAAKVFLADLRKVAPKAKIIYEVANHEARLDTYILTKAPELFAQYRLAERLSLDEFDIELVDSLNHEPEYRWNDLTIGHWDRASKESGDTVKGLMRDRGEDLSQSHVHRSALVVKNLSDKLIVGYETGSLCQQKPSYLAHANWNLGWLALYAEDGVSWGYPIILKDYRFIFNGKVF